MERTRAAISVENGKVTGGIWKERQELIARKTIYSQYDILNGKRDGLTEEQYSNVIENFKIIAGKGNKPYRGEVYSDSELGKWLEAAAYSIQNHPDGGLENLIDELVEQIAECQEEDGYLHTFFQALYPQEKFRHFGFGCELYSMGHLMEGAAAYYRVTGKHRFLDIMCRTADLLCKVFREDGSLSELYDGHPEIELGLIRLYECTGREEYLNLATHFVRVRGKQPCFLCDEPHVEGIEKEQVDFWFGADYHQAHIPVAQQREADGHAVKLCYLYTAVTDLIKRGKLSEEKYQSAVNRVWKNMVKKRMYITGGIGAQAYAERFTRDYDLPSDRGYLETCASVAVCFWARKMLDLYHDSAYADILELELFNGVLVGWSQDGEHYNYTNTLHYKQGISDYRKDTSHLEKGRQKWFHCACCPSNILRLVGTVQDYAVSVQNTVIYYEFYLDGVTSFGWDGELISIETKTQYPFSGKTELKIASAPGSEFSIALRIPCWCESYEVKLNGERVLCAEEKGYTLLTREWKHGDTIELELKMEYKFAFANQNLGNLNQRAALTKGPLIYCLESIDNGSLDNICFSLDAKFEEEAIDETILCSAVLFDGIQLETDEALYSLCQPVRSVKKLRAIPYFYWGNRGNTDMDVWLPYIV